MASVNFEKIKSVGEAKAIIRHCDTAERKQHEHSNKQIDTDMTDNNVQLYGLSYQEACNKLDERLDYLDRNGNNNKRKDRVNVVNLEIPTPKNLPESSENQWFTRVFEIISEQYGKGNVIEAYVHKDEKHNYIGEDNVEHTSRDHGHVTLVPEHDGQLNAKWFTSRRNIIKLNDSIQKMSQDEFDVQFMTGTKRKSRREVEELKNDSRVREYQEQLRKEAERARSALEADFRGRQELLHQEIQKARTAQSEASEALLLVEYAKLYTRKVPKRNAMGNVVRDSSGKIVPEEHNCYDDFKKAQQLHEERQRAVTAAKQQPSKQPVKRKGLEFDF